MASDAQRILTMLSGSHQRGEVRLATVSGVVTTTADMIRYADRCLDAVEIITTKSFQVLPNPGNREPVITEPEPGCFGNSVGLRNPGLEEALRSLQHLRANYSLRCLLNVSLSGSSPEEFIILAKAFAQAADMLELNFSCPHAADGYGSSIGGSWRIASSYMEQIRTALGDDFPVPVIPKLTPNTDELSRIARSLMDSGADALAAVNTVGPELYLEPHSGKPILQNSLGGRGGKSGKWIFQEALEAVRAVRAAVGDETVILGMGGVFTGMDAAEMVRAGADTVGIGSAFGKVHQRNWNSYLQAVRQEAASVLRGNQGLPAFGEPSSRSYLSQTRSMEFQPCRIASVKEHTSQVSLITLDVSRTCRSGEFYFLWIPGIGEKPFSAALGDPLTFLIKRRGIFTEALCSMGTGDTVYLRGPYGEAAPVCSEGRAVLAAGGTGIAVLPALAETLTGQGKQVSVFYGTSDDAEESSPLQEQLMQYGPLTVVRDQGVPGRVLQEVLNHLEGSALYLVGPDPFMKQGASETVKQGVPRSSIYLSLEQMTLCGVGLCGACSCSGALTCQYGTFITYECMEDSL